MMTLGGEGSDRSVGQRPAQPHSDFRVARAFGGGTTGARTSSPSGRVRIHERIAAILNDLNRYGPEMVDHVARAGPHGAAHRASRDLSDAVGHLRSALEAVRKLNA